jgi:hypothetical protein
MQTVVDQPSEDEEDGSEEDSESSETGTISSHVSRQSSTASKQSERAPERALGVAKLSNEGEQYACTMTRESIKSKLVPFKDDFEGRHVLVMELLNHDADAVRERVRTEPLMRKASEYVRAALVKCVKSGGDAATAFLAEERDLRDEDMTAWLSGRDKYDRMMSFGTPKTKRKQRLNMAVIREKVYLTVNMDEMKARAACTRIKDDLKEIDEADREGAAKDPVRFLISKIPTSIRVSADSRRTWAQTLEDELDTAERRHAGSARVGRGGKATAVSPPPGWSWAELVEEVVQRIDSEQATGTINLTLKNGKVAACYNCGKTECQLGIQKCEVRGRCDMVGCQCVWGGAAKCVFRMRAFPKPGEMLRGDKQTMGKKTYDSLKAEWQKRTPDASGHRLVAVTVQTPAPAPTAATAPAGPPPPSPPPSPPPTLPSESNVACEFPTLPPGLQLPATSATRRVMFAWGRQPNTVHTARQVDAAARAEDEQRVYHYAEPRATDRGPGRGLVGGIVFCVRSGADNSRTTPVTADPTTEMSAAHEARQNECSNVYETPTDRSQQNSADAAGSVDDTAWMAELATIGVDEIYEDMFPVIGVEIKPAVDSREGGERPAGGSSDDRSSAESTVEPVQACGVQCGGKRKTNADPLQHEDEAAPQARVHAGSKTTSTGCACRVCLRHGEQCDRPAVVEHQEQMYCINCGPPTYDEEEGDTQGMRPMLEGYHRRRNGSRELGCGVSGCGMGASQRAAEAAGTATQAARNAHGHGRWQSRRRGSDRARTRTEACTGRLRVRDADGGHGPMHERAASRHGRHRRDSHQRWQHVAKGAKRRQRPHAAQPREINQ